MPLDTLDFEGKGVLVADSSSFFPYLNHWEKKKRKKESSSVYGFGPTSILDSIGSPSPPTSTSTLSSSFLGGGGGGGGGGCGGGSIDSAGVAAVSGKQSQKWQETSGSNVGAESGCGSSDLQNIPVGGGDGGIIRIAPTEEKCGLGMEDWESVLSESAAASPSQEQSILRWIMGDMEDPSLGLNKLIQTGGGGGGQADYDFSAGYGVVDQGFPSDSSFSAGATTSNKFGFAQNYTNLSNYKFPATQNPTLSPLPGNLSAAPFNPPTQTPSPANQQSDVKPQIYNPHMIINQNPSFFLPLPINQQGQNLITSSPQAKRHNPGSGYGYDSILPHYHHHHHQHQQQPPPPLMGIMNLKPKPESENPPPQAIIDQLINAAELIQTGNSLLAQGILARLNHHLSPIGKPFQRTAFYLKEALLSLLHGNTFNTSATINNPLTLIFKIAAYKSLSEISPLLQFTNFTSNQAILEALEGSNKIHIIDFDIGYGGQWSSLMQELSLRNGGSPSVRITSFSSPNLHDHHHLELELTRENLTHFANDINMPFEFNAQTLESLNSIHLSSFETIAVNLPTGSSFNNHILRFIKQLSPKIVISIDRGFERTDLPYPHHLIHALQSNSNLLESIDAVNVNQDALQKIERYLIQPTIEKIVWSRFQSLEKTPHWRTLIMSSGFSPISFSNFAESQAECVLKRTPVRGFHVEKTQSSLVLCWQRKEIVSVSAWR